MTVSAPEHCQETEETVLDGMVRAGAQTGLGHEDIYVLLSAAGFKLDRERVRSIVLKRTTASAGATTEAVFPRGQGAET
jgi:hypothetical protein